MRIAVDVKNLALFHGGIAQFFAPLLAHWIAQRPQHEFILVGPPTDRWPLPTTNNWQRATIRWPDYLPRQLRHPVYDNVLFPHGLRSVDADFVFTPYHDVRLPADTPSALMIHDTCIDELAEAYPRALRLYYVKTLERNLRHAAHVLTVSASSRARVSERYGVAADRLHLVYNACHPEFLAAAPATDDVRALRARLAGEQPLVFYPGGAEFRKNVGGLVGGYRGLCAARNVAAPRLVITGTPNAAWEAALASLPGALRANVTFLGYLDNAALKAHYLAADAVVYPSLCEGFGRVALECMATGTSIACSDIGVMREVAGDYPCYFNPHDDDDIATQLQRALAQGRRPPTVDERFTVERVREQFLAVMDAVCR